LDITHPLTDCAAHIVTACWRNGGCKAVRESGIGLPHSKTLARQIARQ
jgi:hypothetical protein